MRKILRTAKIGRGRWLSEEFLESNYFQNWTAVFLLLINYIASQLMGIVQSRWLDIGIVLFSRVYGPRRQQR